MSLNNGSQVDELLRYMRVYEDTLAELEREFAGAIKLGPAGRYGCRLWVRGDVLEFKLGQGEHGEDECFVTCDGLPLKEGRVGRRLYALARHRAAELIGAVRAGHHEYNVRRQANKGRKAER